MWRTITDVFGYIAYAKVYEGGSDWGIDDGPVSKLQVFEYPGCRRGKEVYNYDRGLDFDDLPPATLAKIMDAASA